MIRIAVVAAAHGIKGEVKLRCFTENPLDVDAYGPVSDAKGKEVKLRVLRAAGDNTVIAVLDGATTREAAEAVKGKELFVDASAMPALDEGEYYSRDLVGLHVINAEGEPVARVKSIENFGAGDVLELQLADGSSELYPFTAKFFGDVDRENGTIVFHAPEVLE